MKANNHSGFKTLNNSSFVEKAVTILKASGAKFYIEHNSQTYGSLDSFSKANPKPVKRVKFPGITAFIKNAIDDLIIGEVRVVLNTKEYPIDAVRPSLSSVAANLFGPGACITSVLSDHSGVEIMRIA
jgi:hypothetical protein